MRRTHIRVWILALIALTGVWGTSRGWIKRWSREGVYPYEVGWKWLTHTVRFPVRLREEWHTGKAERARLEAEIQRLQFATSRLSEIEAENASLRGLLAMRARTPGEMVVATVLSRGGAGDWWSSLRLAAGERDGIRLNQPVLGPGGLVGRIVTVTPRTSEVLLITDPNSRVACALDPPVPGVRGIVFGAGARRGASPGLTWLYRIEPLLWRFMDRDAEIPAAARVVTSGLGNVFPPGLPVGRVIDVRLDPQGLYREAELAPLVDPWSLSHVMVMVGSAPP